MGAQERAFIAQRVMPGAVQRTTVPGAAVILAIAAVCAGAGREQNINAKSRSLGIVITALVSER
jgi:hypothetical protein